MCEWETWKRKQPTDEGFYKVIWKRIDTENIFETELAWDAACKCWCGIEFQPEWSENYEIIAWQKIESEPKNNGLKLCPFCGGEADLNKTELGFFVICKDCLCETQVFTTDDDAISIWNHRISLKDE